MKQVNKLKQLDTASFFNKETLSKIIEVSDNSLYTDIKRWLKTRDLIQLKRGMYITRGFLANISNRDSYVEFLANNLKKPSYLSGEYVLQKYGMLTESVFSITSMTLKKTGDFDNDLGNFIYSNIKEDLFTGFEILNKDGFEIKQATKAKALFDFLYLRLWRLPEVNREYLFSLRLNLEEMKGKDFNEFEKYVKLSELTKFGNLTKLLKEISYDK